MLLPECEAINALRLREDWTFRILGEKMALAGVHIPWRTLHYLLKRDDKQASIRDRTLHKLRTFLIFARTQDWIDEGDWSDGPQELRSHSVAARRAGSRTRLRREQVSRR